MNDNDRIKKFLLQNKSARVIATSIDQAWQNAITHQSNSEAVLQLLGELVAAATLLAANLKFDGALLLQMQGQGAVKLLVVECRHDMTIRATVKLRREPAAFETGLQALLNADQQGRFVVILNPPKDQPTRQPYQGVVPLRGETVAEVLEDYMHQSEQLLTRIWLSARPDRVAGLLLQRMPHDGGQETVDEAQAAQSWQTAEAICETISSEELVSISTDTLLHRLFWETPIISLEEMPIVWRCGCDRARVAGMLRSLGADEVNSIVKEQGQVTVTCEFCGTPYVFDPIDATALFESGLPDSRPTLH
ncbi:MAG: Hsp33 family molecular chaperone HslO [Orrella sp.]|jgi:molecular chaperone Hsp33